MKNVKTKAEEILIGSPWAWIKCKTVGVYEADPEDMTRQAIDLGLGVKVVGALYAGMQEQGAWTVEELKQELYKLAKDIGLSSFVIHNHQKTPRIFVSQKEYTEILSPILEKKKENIRVNDHKISEKRSLKNKEDVGEFFQRMKEEFGSDISNDTSLTESFGI